MDRKHARTAPAIRLAAFGALTALLAAAAPNAAQPPGEAKKERERIILVLRTTNTVKDAARLDVLFKQAKKTIQANNDDFNGAKAKATRLYNVGWGEMPLPAEVTKEIYDFVSDPSPILAPGAGGAPITAHTGSVWIIDLGGLGAVKSIKFKYPTGEPDKADPVEVKGGDPRLAGYGLRGVKLTQEFKVLPAEVTVSVLDGAKERTETYKWPEAPDKYWLVQLRDFTGEKEDFFSLLRDFEFTTPIRDVALAKSTTFIVGDLREGETNETSGWSENRFVFRYNLLISSTTKRPRADRMYVLFPLTKEKAEAEAARINAMRDPEAIIKEIRDKKPLLADDEKAVLNPKMEATWLEIPRIQGVGMFRRNFPVEDFAGWRNRLSQAKEPENFSVAVYERVKNLPNEAATVAEATHPIRKGGAVAALDLEEKEWPIGLRTIRAEPKKEAKNEPKSDPK